jgi:polysaccharide biosynthesis/export protein
MLIPRTTMMTGPRLASLAVLVLLAGCGHDVVQPDMGTGAPATLDQADSYVIGAGDVLQVFVYDAPQLSVEVPVRPDGRISTPLVPEMMAAGKPPSVLAANIAEQLKAFVKEPNVTVIVRTFVGPFNRQVRVVGEATQPQAIAYRDHVTVLDVMLIVKGLTRYAAGNRAFLVRNVGNKQEHIPVRIADLLKDGDMDQNVEVQPGDTLVIPQTWF